MMNDNKQFPQLPEEPWFAEPAPENQEDSEFFSPSAETAPLEPGAQQESWIENEISNVTDFDPISAGILHPPVEPEPAGFLTPEAPLADTDRFTDPVMGSEITPDENAMAWHGMTHPSEPEPEFDINVLDTLGLEDEPSALRQELFRNAEYRDAIGDNEEFHAMFNAPAVQEEESVMPQTKTRHARKGRPRRKKGDGLLGIPHLISTVVWLALIVAIGVSLGRLVWVCASDVLAFGREDKVVSITIEQNDTIDTIADKLYNAGLIRYRSLFKLYASLAVDEGDISTGTFELNTLYDYHALVGGMSSSSSYRSVVEDVLIPEGYSCRQIFQLLEEKGICTVSELEEYAANGEFSDFWFLEGLERGDKYCLEGYLFPDTYDFYAGSTPREALGKMLNGFENRVTEEYTGQLAALNEHISAKMRADGRSEDYIAQHQFTFRDVLIVASLIEKETSSASESYTIASVIYNRLFSWGNTPSYLNIDASVIYATGDAENIDTSIDHPYNTYKNTGLTPGPIANPGLASIDAALNPASTNYYYYVLNPSTGKHVFSRTLAEHEKYVQQFAEAAAAAASWEDE